MNLKGKFPQTTNENWVMFVGYFVTARGVDPGGGGGGNISFHPPPIISTKLKN